MSAPDGSRPADRFRWGAALLGQFVFIFAVLALSGPGRLDIDDGQLRYEVARSLVDHGDSAIRDPRITFAVFPGRGGLRYTNARFPQSGAGVLAIWAADWTGPVSEGRRHFFFTLTSAAACALLAVTYSVWFRGLGLSRVAALLWGTAGVLCTPSWYYGTSTFDDILGSAVAVLAVAAAFLSRRRWPWLGAAAAGLLLGLAFNCKQPLGVFVLPVLAVQYDRGAETWKRLGRAVLVFAGLALGILACQAYEAYKFPPEYAALQPEIIKQWGPVFTANPLPGFLGLAVSPAAGCLWYCPTLVLSFAGLAGWYRLRKPFCLAVLAASGTFVLFLSFLYIFKGDGAWGPRYLTPIFALLWVFVPAGAARLRPRLVALLLLLGVGVQLLGLSVDPLRLYVRRNLDSRFYVVDPWLYFDPAVSHLVNRPREIVEIVTAPRAESYTPAPSPTDCLPFLGAFPHGPKAIDHYHVLNSLRPWWIGQQYLNPEDRPVALWPTFGLLLGFLFGGLALMGIGCRGAREQGSVGEVSKQPAELAADLITAD